MTTFENDDLRTKQGSMPHGHKIVLMANPLAILANNQAFFKARGASQ